MWSISTIWTPSKETLGLRAFDDEMPFSAIGPLSLAQAGLDERLLALVAGRDEVALARPVTLRRQHHLQVERCGPTFSPISSSTRPIIAARSMPYCHRVRSARPSSTSSLSPMTRGSASTS